MTLTFGSLFSGIGGIDLGLERAGMTCLWQIEIDPYCQSVLSRHWPEVPKYDDVFDLSGSSLPAVDAICGGFPCQPVSLSGRREGQGDERWLWPQFARLVGEVGPRYVIVENVPGIYSLGGTEVVADLAEMGYDCEWGSFPAETFGAPHVRQRFVLVAYSNDDRLNRQGLHEERGKELLFSTRGSGGREDTGGTGRGEAEKMADSQRQRLQGFGGQRGLREGSGEVEIGGSSGSGGEEEVQGSSPPKRRGRLLRRPGPPNEHWRHDPADFPESGVGRVANGIPNRVDRIRSLGNSVVPQLFEHVGRMMMRDAERRGYLDEG